MPFKSEKQKKYLFANKPKIAKRWAKEYKDGGLSSKDLTVHQRTANAAGMKPVIATKPKGDPTGMGLKGQALKGASVKNKKNGGIMKKNKGGIAKGSREGSVIDTPVSFAKGGKLDIKKAIKKPGALRKSLGVKKGEKIPASKLNKAAKAKGKLGQRARFAKTLAKLRKGKRG